MFAHRPCLAGMLLGTFAIYVVICCQHLPTPKKSMTSDANNFPPLDGYETSSILPKSQCDDLIQLTYSPSWQWTFNSGNSAKVSEFSELFAKRGLKLKEIMQTDLPEIQASDIEVIIHKASQLPEEGVIVEDSALDVDQANIGVNLKWHMKNIESYIGRKAKLHSLLAYRANSAVFVFKRTVEGCLVEPRGPQITGSRLYAYFQPNGSDKTLAEKLHDEVNPRALALNDLIGRNFSLCAKPISRWRGDWQKP